MYFKSIKSFEFITSLVIVSNVLDDTLSLTVELQWRKIDIVESLKHINLLKAQLKELRESVDKFHDRYYDEALELAKSVKVEEKYIRVCTVQTARENYQVAISRDYYRVKLTIPFLDHLIEQMEFRFPSEMCNLYYCFYIIPGIFLQCKDFDWKTEFMKFVSGTFMLNWICGKPVGRKASNKLCMTQRLILCKTAMNLLFLTFLPL